MTTTDVPRNDPVTLEQSPRWEPLLYIQVPSLASLPKTRERSGDSGREPEAESWPGPQPLTSFLQTTEPPTPT